MRTLRLALAAGLLAACGSPPVHTSADRVGIAPTGTLSGQVVVQTLSRGNVIVLLFEATNPPPPIGTGRPIAFDQLPAPTVFGDSVHDNTNPGPFAADYSFPLVGPGTYLIAAVLDFDACLVAPSPTCQLADFDPFFDVTDEPNANDLQGGHVDAMDNLAPVVVPASTQAGIGVDVSNVAVVIADTPLPDRPAFEVLAQSSAVNPAPYPTPFELQARPVNLGPVVEQQPAFLVRYQDENGDGVPDLGPEGVPLLWPKIFIRKIADLEPGDPVELTFDIDAGLLDENDLGNTGQLDPTGLYYDPTSNPPTVTPSSSTPSLILLEATIANPDALPDAGAFALVPVQLFAQLAFPDGGPDVAKVLPQEMLPMVLLPQALDASNPLSPVPLAGIPAGRYAVIVEQFTGQTWRLPNELEPLVVPELGVVDGGLADQGWIFTVGQ